MTESKSKRAPQSHSARPSRTDEKSKRTPSKRAPRGTSEAHADSHEKLAKIAGLPAVSALFRSDPQRIMRLYYDERMKNAVGSFCAELARLHRPYRLVSGEELTKIAGTVLHGGIVAATLPRAIPDFDPATAEQWARQRGALVILDGVGNPHNLGAIARTLAFFGFRHLAISDHPEQAAPSDAAYRVAEGGLDAMDILRIKQMPRTLKRLQKSYFVVGTALMDGACSVEELPPDDRPVALVFGNEENGIPPQTLSACEAVVQVPGVGQIQSLNVSATAAILLYELAKRSRSDRRTSKRPG